MSYISLIKNYEILTFDVFVRSCEHRKCEK